MRFTLSIDCENAAFGDTIDAHLDEVSRLLREVARRLDGGEDAGRVRDGNGNSVGEFSLEGERLARKRK